MAQYPINPLPDDVVGSHLCGEAACAEPEHQVPLGEVLGHTTHRIALHMNEDHLSINHHVMGQTMLRYDNTVPAHGLSRANQNAIPVPAAGPHPARV